MPSGVYIRTEEMRQNMSLAQKAVGRTTVPANCKNTGRTRFKKGHGLNEKNINWKETGYSSTALHSWIKRRLAKPLGCNHCGEIKPLDLANKSHEYKRELNDWLWLCRKCHAKYDDYVNKSWVTRKKNMQRRVIQ